MRELEKIKQERAEEERRRQEEKERQDDEAKDNAIRFGNPLLNVESNATFNVKKRYQKSTFVQHSNLINAHQMV